MSLNIFNTNKEEEQYRIFRDRAILFSKINEIEIEKLDKLFHNSISIKEYKKEDIKSSFFCNYDGFDVILYYEIVEEKEDFFKSIITLTDVVFI